jgi:hypothetical protein
MSTVAGAANVLWTGGWDSTFRVLEILLVRKNPVQPHYVLDPRRRSSLLELQAMQAIRERMGEREPEAGERLEPVRLASIYDLPEDPTTRERLRALRERAHLGHQYEFLARYAAKEGLNDLELSIHSHRDGVYGPLFFVRDHLTRVEDDNGGYWCLDPRAITADPALALFAPFRFPLLRRTKQQMQHEARAMGVLDLMHLTWFCHTPVRQKPCGRCPPCIQAIEEGMRDRVSLRALGRYYGRPLERVSHLGRRVARALAHPRASIDRIRGKGR